MAVQQRHHSALVSLSFTSTKDGPGSNIPRSASIPTAPHNQWAIMGGRASGVCKQVILENELLSCICTG